MLERLRAVVFSAKNDGGVHFCEKYFFGGIQGPQNALKMAILRPNLKKNMFPNTQSVLEWPGINEYSSF